MGRNDSEARGSRRRRRSTSRPRNLTIEDASMLYEEDLLVPPDWRMPGAWRIAQDGRAVPPMPDGQDLLDVIAERRNARVWDGNNVNSWFFASTVDWKAQLHTKRDTTLARPSNPYGDKWNKFILKVIGNLVGTGLVDAFYSFNKPKLGFQ